MFKQNIKAVLNSQRPDSKGNFPLRIRVTIQRQVTYYPTGIMLKEDQLKDGIIINHPNKALLNTELRRKISQLEKDHLESAITGENVARVKKNMDLKFTEYAEKKIKQWKGTQAKSTIKHKNSYLAKLNAFNPRLKLKDMDKDMLTSFEDYCRGLGNVSNTVWSASKFVKSILNAAVEDGIMARSPAKGFKGAKYSDPLRQGLSEEEIQLIETFADNPLNSQKLRNVANWFLFGCYTGLRYGDMHRFKGFVNGKIILATEKTGEPVSIFATEKIKQAYSRIDKGVYTNQKMNDYLKIIAAGVGIDRNVTCHLARHTFAINFLDRGGDIYILSKILGHTNLKTTSIYGKVSNKLADAEMARVWDCAG